MSEERLQEASHAEVDQLMVDFEMADRNLQALKAWRTRKASKVRCLDAYPLFWRERLNFWLDQQRELAERWMFKRRCTRRWSTQSALPPLPFDAHRRSTR